MTMVLNSPSKRIHKNRHFAPSISYSTKWVIENVHEGDHIVVYQNDRQNASEICVVTNVANTGTVSARSVGGGRDYQGLVHIDNPNLKKDEFVKKNSSFDHTAEHKAIKEVRYAADKAMEAVAKLKDIGPQDATTIAKLQDRITAMEAELASANRDLAKFGNIVAELTSKKK